MIKLVYIGEDDYMACLRHGEVLLADGVSGDGSYYIVKNNRGEEIYIPKNEVVIYE